MLHLISAKNESDKSNLPNPDDFSKALYIIDIGQNDLGACFRSLTNPQCIATFPDIIQDFATAVQVSSLLGTVQHTYTI